MRPDTSMFHQLSILFTIMFLGAAGAQEKPILNFSHDLEIVINDSSREIKPGLIDSLKNSFKISDIRFAIVRSESKNGRNVTIIRIPQTYELDQVLVQLVIYYGLYPTEEEKSKEEVRVFPYFYPIHKKPFLRCRYKKEGKLIIQFNNWEKTPVPAEPGPEEKQIFNDLMNHYISSASSLDAVDETAIETFAGSKSLPAAYVKRLYQDILLWQLSQ